jgi:hypothetical protein
VPDEPAAAGPTTAAERYEQLRSRVLHGQADGWRLGLGVLAGRGMVAWIRAWASCPPAPRTSASAAASVPPAGSPTAELVRVLAAMALARA